MSTTYDAIVVGSGASGSWAAKELTEAGLSVLLVEAGPAIDEQRHYRMPAPKFAGEDVSFRVRRAIAGQHVQAKHPTFNRIVSHFHVNDRESSYSTPRDKPFLWTRGQQIGGRLHTWGRVAIRMSDLDFKAASRDGEGVDWPISYSDLVPAYDKVETFLGLTGSVEGIPHVPDGKYSMPQELNALESKFRAQVAARWPDRKVIQLRTIPRQETLRIPLPLSAAMATGRLHIRPNALVARINVDAQTGQATGVTFVDRETKIREDVQGRLVFLLRFSVRERAAPPQQQVRPQPDGPRRLERRARALRDGSPVHEPLRPGARPRLCAVEPQRRSLRSRPGARPVHARVGEPRR